MPVCPGLDSTCVPPREGSSVEKPSEGDREGGGRGRPPNGMRVPSTPFQGMLPQPGAVAPEGRPG